MIKARTIEQAQDGSFFATNAVTMIYEDMDGRNIIFFISPDGLYSTVHDGVVRMSGTSEGDVSGLSSEQQALKKQLVKVIRAGVKGIFMMWGDKLMELFYGSKQHPRPPKDKHLDLVNWYLEEFTKVLIAHMMKNDVVLKGQFTAVGSNVISIDEVSTRPVPGVSPPTSDTGNGQEHVRLDADN